MTRIKWRIGAMTGRRMALLGAGLTVAIATTLVSTAGAAHADTHTARWHTASGKGLYITTDGTTPFGAAESGNPPGRILTSDSSGRYHDPDGVCGQIGCLEWNMILDSGYCLAATNTSGNIDIKSCSADGTVWAFLLVSSTAGKWISVDQSNAHGSDYYMTGDNVVGDRLTTDCNACHSGDLQQWVAVAA